MDPLFPFPPHPARPERPPPSLPAVPAEHPPYSFPVIATLAPVAVSALIWTVTQSSFALLFALLGPVVAVASLADSRVQRRRRRRAEQRRFETELADAHIAIRAGHEAERAQLDALYPGVHAVLAGGTESEGWPGVSDPAGRARSPLPVTLGRGTVQSALALDGESPARVVDSRVAAALREARAAAAVLEDGPVVVDARLGVGVCGPLISAMAVARAVIVQLADTLSPGLATIRADPSAWGWATALPHRLARGTDPLRGAQAFEFVLDAAQSAADPPAGLPDVITVAVASRAGDLPRQCGVIVAAGTGGSASAWRRGPLGDAGEVRVDFASECEAALVARALRRRAESEGLTEGQLPERVQLASLAQPAADGRGLRCVVGRAGAVPWVLDLVADGPHAVIGGTTGSGKSELLISWVLSMAAAHPPSDVTFLLVDFKGGASFNAIDSLPHSVGVITDLDAGAAQRALESLRAELLFRERTFTRAGARSIEDLMPPTMPRLVIVVDEFAALASEFPELHRLFADLASRGRSLGIHLVLCTQRPAEALRDSILANCTLRIALRLTSRADSSAVIGTGAAADLPRRPLGRALASVAGEEPRAVHVAISDAADAARVSGMWAGHGPVRRPWRDPLPRLVPHAELAGAVIGDGGPGPDARSAGDDQEGFVFGICDLPREQRRDLATYRPLAHGNLLVCGAQGAGKSMVLDAIAAGGPVGATHLIPGEIEGAWDALTALCAALATGAPMPRVVLLDDVDSLFGRFGQEHQLDFADMLARLLRDAPRHGTTAVLATQQLPTALHSVTALCGSRLLLRLPSRQDHLLAGGIGDQYDERMPPGGGVWESHRVQVGHLPPRQPSPAPRPPTLDLRPGATTAVVSASPGDFAARVFGAHGIRIVDIGSADASTRADTAVHTILLGDLQAWQGAWSILAAVRGRLPMAFDGCTPGDVRAVTGTRRLPPPLAPTSRSLWLLTAGDRFERVALPGERGGAPRESALNRAETR